MTNEAKIDHHEKYLAAVGLMVLTGKGSTSYVQRVLGIGYNQAARLVEQMERDGIMAKPNSVGKREVLVMAPARREIGALSGLVELGPIRTAPPASDHTKEG